MIVGGGPSGLAAAIACERRQLDYEVLEKGTLVNSIFRFPPHMVFFTTPELLEIGNLPFVSPFEKPTRTEALRYYRRVADTYALQVTTDETVVRVAPAPGGGGMLETLSRSADDKEHVRASRAVILATGYYDYPNRLNVSGEDLPHVSHYYREAHPFHRKRVVVVGGANSAAEAALELYRAGASVTLVHRREAMSASVKYWVLPDIQNRIREGAIAARFGARLVEIEPTSVRIEDLSAGGYEDLPADAVFLLTGYHTDREFLQRCGVQIEPVTCMPRHDAETLETDVPNLFLAGGVMAGANAAPIFIENGRLHGEKVVATIAKRLGRE